MDYVQELERIRVSRGLSQMEIANEIGISQQVYSNFINKVSSKPNAKIVEYVTSYLVELKNVTNEHDSNQSYLDFRKNKKLTKKKNKSIPFYDDVVASASNVPTNMIGKSINPVESIDVGDLLSDSQAAIRVYSNSMLPNYPPGCVVGIVETRSDFIQPGEVYVIETNDQRILKRLFYKDDDPESDSFLCYSDNIMKFEGGARSGKDAYPPFFLHKQHIIRMFIVTGVIKRNTNSAIFKRN